MKMHLRVIFPSFRLRYTFLCQTNGWLFDVDSPRYWAATTDKGSELTCKTCERLLNSKIMEVLVKI